jgi:hypothetical protein
MGYGRAASVGTLTASETATLSVKENNEGTAVQVITPLYPATASSVSVWSTASTVTAWGGSAFKWSAPVSEIQAINSEKFRVSKYVRKFSYLWEYHSSTSGAAPIFLNTQIWESKR